MNSFILFNRLYHSFCIPLARKNVHTQSKCGNPIDRNTLMNGENVSMKPCNRLQDNRQKPRFIVHLDNKGDRLSPCLFMKWKNIIFVFVERNISFSLLLVSAYQFTCPFFKDICFYTLDILSHHTKIRKKYLLQNHYGAHMKKAVLISDSLFYSFISSVRSISDMH